MRLLASALLLLGLSGCFFATHPSTHPEAWQIINWIIGIPQTIAGFFICWLIYNKIRDFIAPIRLRAEQEQLHRQYEERQKPFQEAREKQIEELIAILPKTAPQGLRATIRVNKIHRQVNLREAGTGTLQPSNTPYHAVDMILELSEKYRGVIEEQQLADIIVETAPKYTNADILNIIDDQDKLMDDFRRRGRFEDYVAMEAIRNTPQRDFKSYQRETRDITLGEYLRRPCTRIFATLPEANDHADRLRNIILPKIKELLERNDRRDLSETVEL